MIPHRLNRLTPPDVEWVRADIAPPPTVLADWPNEETIDYRSYHDYWIAAQRMGPHRSEPVYPGWYWMALVFVALCVAVEMGVFR